MLKTLLSFGVLVLAFLVAACGPAVPEAPPADAPQSDAEPFIIGAIPDQDPEKLQRRFGLLAEYLSDELGVPVEYKIGDAEPV